MTILLYLVVAVLIIVPVYLVIVMMKINQAKRKLEWLRSIEFTTLRIDVPKNNEKSPLSAEQMFAAIHGIYSESSEYQQHISFEIVAKNKFIQFYIRLPKHIKDFVEGQVYAQYPTVEINEVEDYTKSINPQERNFAVCGLELTKPDVYPIRSFDSFDVDPLSSITSVMSNLNPEEEVWFQLIVRPVGDDWQEKGNSIVSAVRAGKKPGGKGMLESLVAGTKNFLKIFIAQAINPGAEVEAEKSETKLPATVEEALSGIENKITKLGFESKMRILCIASDAVTASVKCQSIAATFKQFNTTNLNGFTIGEAKRSDFESWQEYVNRSFENAGNILNITELASVFHLPNKSVETPNIVWSGSKKGETPANLPLRENTPGNELTIIGVTNFRNVNHEFGIKKDDRRRHVYIIGKSGVGKSVLIENMAIDDVVENRGVIIIDPHGDLADKVLSIIPEHRIDDVIMFDPADRAYPIAFNLLETVDDDFKGMVASGFVGIFKKIFGDSWGPRLEHILRNTVLALLDYPDSTMLDIPSMLTDGRFRDRVVEKVKDPVIKDFWINEFAQYDSKFRTEAVSPILNKVGQFLATATIRNIVGQPKSKIDIRDIMDNKKILLVNLSRGKIGEDNSALLGAMMVTKIQLAAMSRADVAMEKRPDSYLYVDEFQNFATESFAVILAEARKYNLNLTVANQYIAQMPEGVRDAVFGNAGTIISFRVGGADAEHLVKEFEPVFDTNDMVNLDKYNIYIKLLIDGVSAPAFSAHTLPPVQTQADNSERIINLSRQKYSTARAYVEEQIANRNKRMEDELKAEAEAFRQGGLEAILVKDRTVQTKPLEDKKTEKETIVELKADRPQEKLEKAGEGDSKANNGADEPEIEKKQKPRTFKYQNIIGDKIFKEQTARGGVKWYVGEDIDLDRMNELGVEISDDAKKMIELANKVSANSKDKKEEPKSKEAKNRKEEKLKDSSDSIKKEKGDKTNKQKDEKKDKKTEQQSNENTKELTQPKKDDVKKGDEPKVSQEDKKPKIEHGYSSDKINHLNEGEEVEIEQ